jgi:hypothetical protein
MTHGFDRPDVRGESVVVYRARTLTHAERRQRRRTRAKLGRDQGAEEPERE